MKVITNAFWLSFGRIAADLLSFVLFAGATAIICALALTSTAHPPLPWLLAVFPLAGVVLLRQPQADIP